MDLYRLYWLRYKNIKISFLSIKNTGKSLPLVEPQPTKKTVIQFFIFFLMNGKLYDDYHDLVYSLNSIALWFIYSGIEDSI